MGQGTGQSVAAETDHSTVGSNPTLTTISIRSTMESVSAS